MSQGKKLAGGKTTRFKFSIGTRDLAHFRELAAARHIDTADYLRRLIKRELRAGSTLNTASDSAPPPADDEPVLPRLLPHQRSHLGGPRVSDMRRAGFSDSEVKQRVTDWLLKPIPRTNRLNGYRRELGLASRPQDRLINHLTPEQRAKAESIFATICRKHERDLYYYPWRRGVYWACAVSRVRALATYDQQRSRRNKLKGTLNKIVGLPPATTTT